MILICLIRPVLTILAVQAILGWNLCDFFQLALLVERVRRGDRSSTLGYILWYTLQIVFSRETHLFHFAESYCPTLIVNLLS